MKNGYNKPILRRRRVRIGAGLTIVGLLLFILGAQPAWLGLDRSPVTGFVQVATFLIGLGIICLGGYICLDGLWRARERTIAADIGLRLIGTGYVVAVFAGMADIFGLSNRNLPSSPVFGTWQMAGVLLGEVMIAIGLLLLIPYKQPERHE